MDCFVVKVARSATEDHISLELAWHDLGSIFEGTQIYTFGYTSIERTIYHFLKRSLVHLYSPQLQNKKEHVLSGLSLSQV